MTKKIAFIIQGGTDKFLAPVRNWVSDRFAFREINGSDTDGIHDALEWADLTWVEWVQDAAVRVSRLKRRGKLVMRMHGFEAYTSLPADVAWQNVDAFMVVSHHMTDILRLRIPDIEQHTEVFVLPNGVDTTQFNAPKDKTTTGKIAYVGQLRHTKNLPLVLQCFAAAHRDAPSRTLHLAGEYAGAEVEVMELMLYIDHMTHAMGLADAVTFHGQVSDMPAWLGDKDALISASIRESFGLGIAEAMACEVRPLIHNFPGAGSIFPQELIFNTVEECRTILAAEGPPSRALRAYALEHWPLATHLESLEELFDKMIG
ncbi:glycosyltransferase family 4 protein [uncultured Pseudodesulfovibrio sp.]|uniref:glycosyltransferase family 4 protein n=1 Tax=uncultured Pseudodesulfovibrio sp. TaxID=2035858 RepID=UPI0029C7E79A|nr:glycosyltransferase family 4 protein [uncultured Pseudodesulfovibrio sp.]